MRLLKSARILKSALIAGGICVGLSGFAHAQDSGFSSYTAVVKANGKIARGVGVQSASRAGAGRYAVEFARDVKKCTYVASPVGKSGGQVSVRSTPGNARKLRVYTYSNEGQRKNSGFALLVTCG